MDIQQDIVAQTRARLASAGYGAIYVLARNGFYGCPEHAPYDRIVATVSCSDLSPHWLGQLQPDGFMLIPLAHGDPWNCPLVRLNERNRFAEGKVIRYSGFMRIHGELFLDTWLPDNQMKKMAPLSGEGAPDAEYDLFPGLQGWVPRTEFYYFLALRTRRTSSFARGIMFGSEEDFVLIGDDSIQLYGDQAPSFYGELESAYREWERLGKPGMLDYEPELLPLSETGGCRQVADPTPG